MSVAAAQLLHALVQSGLLARKQLAELIRSCYWGEFPRPEAVRATLLQHGWLTEFQISEIAHGRAGGLRLGRYFLLEKLGEGGFSRVFRARDTRMLRDVTLKKLLPEMGENPVVARRFLREIVLLGKLRTKHLIFALDADCIDDVWFIVYEYVKGINLRELVRQQGPLSWQQACELTLQGAEGLKYIWQLGMTHRDIKPANLLLEEGTRTVKILDFGLAKAKESFRDCSQVYSLTSTGTVLGTPDFMAPEQFESAQGLDIRADLYSLGCTMYYLLAGRPPFAGLSAPQLLRAVLQQEPEPIARVRPDVPRPVSDVARKLMAKRPEARFQDPEQALQALEEVLRRTTGQGPDTVILDKSAASEEVPDARKVEVEKAP